MHEHPRESLCDGIANIYAILSAKRKCELVTVLFLMLVGAAAEVVAISAVVPFLALLTNDTATGQFAWLQAAFSSLGAESLPDRLMLATAVLCAAAVAAGAFRILLTRKIQKFVFTFGHELLVETQRRALYQSYEWHVRHNSAEQVAAIAKVEVVTYGVLLQLMHAITAAFFIAFVGLLLTQLAPFPLAAAAAAIGGAYLAIGAYSRKRLRARSSVIDSSLEERIKVVQESFGGIRDLILDGTQKTALAQFRTTDCRLAIARADAAFLSTVPRYAVEAAGIVAIAIATLLLAQRHGGILVALPVLGALVLAAQRLLPLVQQLYVAWSSVSANQSLLQDISKRLQLAVPPEQPNIDALPFKHSIEFQNVCFEYPTRDHFAVRELNFIVPKGARVAVVGQSGSGKSTTADLLMGLIAPSAGAVLVDGVPLDEFTRPAWRANIAHVPQQPFLADGTIAQNVALSPDFDPGRLHQAIADAQLKAFVHSLPDGYATRVGEGGARLSGGQRQRLAIARAIYKQAPVLVLDEATGALDQETELAVLGTLDRLQAQARTIFIIAHRGAAKERSDFVLSLKDGRVAGWSPSGAGREAHTKVS